MKHATQEELVLFYYGEQESAGEHLAGCEECRREYQAVQRTLNAVDSLPVPERPEDYAAMVWKRIAPRLPARPRGRMWWTAMPKWAMAAGLLIGAFLLGRVVPRPAAPPELSMGASKGVLAAVVGDHLDRTQRVLSEIANAGDPGAGTLDIRYERRTAADLVDAGRLYRAAADRAGDRATAALLEDIERVMLEIAHSPDEVGAARYEELRHEIDDRGLLFKVRVFRGGIGEKEGIL
jgi:hypothetical protein